MQSTGTRIQCETVTGLENDSPSPVEKVQSKEWTSVLKSQLTTAELVAEYQAFLSNKRRKKTGSSSDDDDIEFQDTVKKYSTQSSDSGSDFEDPDSDADSVMEANVEEFVISTTIVSPNKDGNGT
ncbi:uncharacterized protein LOC144417946 [Styela clava]